MPTRLILALTLLLLAALLAARVDKLTDNVYTLKLAGCYLDYHASIQAVARACPGVDYIRLWPWPVEQAWQETPEPFPGRLARSLLVG